MAVVLGQPIQEVRVIDKVEITGFSIDYENTEMSSTYLLYLSDGTPYQRGRFMVNNQAEIDALMGQVETLIETTDKTLAEAAGEVAYAFVLSKLEEQVNGN